MHSTNHMLGRTFKCFSVHILIHRKFLHFRALASKFLSTVDVKRQIEENNNNNSMHIETGVSISR